jgi:hypothetical protein
VCEPYTHRARVVADYWVCDLPQPLGGHPFTGGVTARYFRANMPQPFLVREEPVISYAFFPDECLVYKGAYQPPCRAEWEGYWHVEQAGMYQLLAQARLGHMALTIDDRVVRRPREQAPSYAIDDQANTALELTAGEHRVRLSVTFLSIESAGARLQVRRPETSTWELVRFGSAAARPSVARTSSEADG